MPPASHTTETPSAAADAASAGMTERLSAPDAVKGVQGACNRAFTGIRLICATADGTLVAAASRVSSCAKLMLRSFGWGSVLEMGCAPYAQTSIITSGSSSVEKYADAALGCIFFFAIMQCHIYVSHTAIL